MITRLKKHKVSSIKIVLLSLMFYCPAVCQELNVHRIYKINPYLNQFKISNNKICDQRFNILTFNKKLLLPDTTNNKKEGYSIKKQVFTGFLGNICFGFMGILIGSKINSKSHGSSDVIMVHGNFHNAAIGGFIGTVTGSFIGNYTIARNRKEKGSTWVGLTFSIAGGILGYQFTERTNGFSLLLIPPIMTTIGFNIKL